MSLKSKLFAPPRNFENVVLPIFCSSLASGRERWPNDEKDGMPSVLDGNQIRWLGMLRRWMVQIVLESMMWQPSIGCWEIEMVDIGTSITVYH
ncbi:hypothetical protein V6N11_076981 [Hibiscus sabdariffa]|uniref:Uncharacterized protein n=1 Tax=Hibiscus sabdariffa TaxID=183260 RepID=A0ABR2TCJ2_9ROSI